MINADKPHLWKADIAQSVDLYNQWFLHFAPQAFRSSREKATTLVEQAFGWSQNLSSISPATLQAHPDILPILRMCTAPPIARDRLVGLSSTTKNLVSSLEEGRLPPQMALPKLAESFDRICQTLLFLLDVDLFPWLAETQLPSDEVRLRSATVVADRLTGANANPIVRNAQEQRQLEKLRQFLIARGYVELAPQAGSNPTIMAVGTFWFRFSIEVGTESIVHIPVDAIIQPKQSSSGTMPVLIEAKSAGDFTNVNKRRKEEATKIRQLRERYGLHTQLILFLCGYFDPGYLGYEAAEGLDWVWEHRIDDMEQLL